MSQILGQSTDKICKLESNNRFASAYTRGRRGRQSRRPRRHLGGREIARRGAGASKLRPGGRGPRGRRTRRRRGAAAGRRRRGGRGVGERRRGAPSGSWTRRPRRRRRWCPCRARRTRTRWLRERRGRYRAFPRDGGRRSDGGYGGRRWWRSSSCASGSNPERYFFFFFIGTEALALLPSQAQPKPSAELKRQNFGHSFLAPIQTEQIRRVCAIPAKRGRVEHAKFRKNPAPERRADFIIRPDAPGLRSPALRNFKFNRKLIQLLFKQNAQRKRHLETLHNQMDEHECNSCSIGIPFEGGAQRTTLHTTST
jgi:hypothetical protein